MIHLGPGSAATELILVRHAMPVTDPAVPPHRWHLAAPCSLTFPRGAYLVAGSEPKAAQTLSFDRPVPQDPGFDEVRRPFAWRDDHREQARAYVDGLAHPGWEPHSSVVARFDAALIRHAALAAGRPLVAGTHGMALTCWPAALIPGGVTAGEFWAGLGFPDVVEL
ncbi:MAG: histidine phosphatase family protein [Actinomycetota bacterium]|nr:histidine phosphatase family protein [Actinomycetota bacterium]